MANAHGPVQLFRLPAESEEATKQNRKRDGSAFSQMKENDETGF
jgi:hypothetical protein